MIHSSKLTLIPIQILTNEPIEVAVEYNESNFNEPDEVTVDKCDDWRPKRKQKLSLTDFSQIKRNSPRISKQKANLRINSITSPKSDKKTINKIHKKALKKQKHRKLLKIKSQKNKPKISKEQQMSNREEVEIKNSKIDMPKISKEQLMTQIKEVATISKTKSGKKVNNSKVRKVSCRQCENCLKPDCSQCTFCLDKPKFGGPNKMKQKCTDRICQNMSLYN